MSVVGRDSADGYLDLASGARSGRRHGPDGHRSCPAEAWQSVTAGPSPRPCWSCWTSRSPPTTPPRATGCCGRCAAWRSVCSSCSWRACSAGAPPKRRRTQPHSQP